MSLNEMVGHVSGFLEGRLAGLEEAAEMGFMGFPLAYAVVCWRVLGLVLGNPCEAVTNEEVMRPLTRENEVQHVIFGIVSF